nr:hypothetical protein [Tanacetum cinerariifolium]
MMSNQIRPLGFPPIPNNHNVQLNQWNNQNRFIQNQNQGNNFNQGPVYQSPVFQPPSYQAPAYQAPAPQTQCVSKEDFLAYVKANDAVMKNMQTQGQNMQNYNTIANSRSDLNAITTLSGVSYDGPKISPLTSFLPKVVEDELETTKDIVHPTNNGSTEDVQPQVVKSETTSEPVNSPIFELVAYLVSALRPNLRPSIPYPSIMQDQKLRDKANDQREIFFQIFKDLNFNISFADALILMPKFGPSIKSLLTNKDKLSLAYLGASINLMPLFVWNKLYLPDLTPTRMTPEPVDRSISHSVGVAVDVYVKVCSFNFSADFVVVDFNVDPRVPLILERSFLKTGRALMDVFEGELTLRVSKEAITFNLDQTSRYSANYNDMSAKRIDVIDMACEEYLQEVLVDAFLVIEDDPTLSEVDPSYLDPEGDILLLEAFLNNDPSLPPPNQRNYLPEVELKDLPPHLKYAFMEGDDKFPVIIAKDLSVEENAALITVLMSHKRAIAWKLFDIKGINCEFCTHKILMEKDFEPAGGFTVMENEDNELILTLLVKGWRVYLDYLLKEGATTDSTSGGTATKKERTIAITTEDMQNKTIGGNEATKKTKKNLLKQQYGNFKAEGSKTLEQTFNRLQIIVSQLEFIDIEIEQDDLNQKFLTSLALEWLMHTIVWRNISDLDTMSLDDLYNHLKVSRNEEVNTASISTASTQVSPAGPNVVTAKKKISIQGTDVAGFDKSKVECFNCHKMGHFARECRAPKSQDRGRRDNYRQGPKVEEQAPKALMAINGVGCDLSFMANEEENHALVTDEEAPTEFALMAKTSAKNEVFDNSLCSKTCKKNTDSLNRKITELTDKLSDSENMLYHYKLGLSQVEGRLVEFKN